MAKKITFFILLVLLTAGLATGLYSFELGYLQRSFETSLALAVIYFFTKVLLEGFISERVGDLKTRYSLRKVASILFVAVSVVVIMRVWTVDTQTLLVTYGLVAAGVAVALQDVFKNLAGGLTILLTGIYRVGDRIEIDGLHGDVIDIGVFTTAVLEINNWVGGNQSTGRISHIPNGFALYRNVHNYSKEHDFLWDELMFPIDYDSDWKAAVRMIERVARTSTNALADQADKQIGRLARKYYISDRDTAPKVYISPNDNWISLYVRFISPIHGRRDLRTEMAKEILEKIEKSKSIQLASSSLVLHPKSSITIKKSSARR